MKNYFDVLFKHYGILALGIKWCTPLRAALDSPLLRHVYVAPVQDPSSLQSRPSEYFIIALIPKYRKNIIEHPKMSL
jgi:hypothetical protein